MTLVRGVCFPSRRIEEKVSSRRIGVVVIMYLRVLSEKEQGRADLRRLCHGEDIGEAKGTS